MVAVIELLSGRLLSQLWVSIRPAGLLTPKTWPVDLGAQRSSYPSIGSGCLLNHGNFIQIRAEREDQLVGIEW